jgi:hypothetical protein
VVLGGLRLGGYGGGEGGARTGVCGTEEGCCGWGGEGRDFRFGAYSRGRGEVARGGDGGFARCGLPRGAPAVAAVGGAVAVVVHFHAGADCFARGDAGYAFGFALDGFEVVGPCADHFGHWRWGRGELGVFAVGVQHGVVMGQEGVLGADLGGEDWGKERERGLDEAGEDAAEVAICCFVLLSKG